MKLQQNNGQMKLSQLIIMLIILTIIFTTCKKSEPETTGSINGVITNSKTSEPISGALIVLGTNNPINSNSDGTFQFKDLQPQDYTLTITKTGYNNKTETVTVTANQTVTKDIGLTPIETAPILNVSATLLDFGSTDKTLPFNITNKGTGTLEWQIIENLDWLSVNPQTGTTTTETDNIVVSIDENLLPSGQQEENITVNSTNGGTAIITVKIQGKSAPIVETVSSSNINDNSFSITGNLTSLGTRVNSVSQRGFCYSTINQLPTINDNKLELGDTNQLGTFSGQIINLQSGTPYYVRAFATNSAETGYGDPLTIVTTTLNVGLVAYYSFNDGSATDLSGYNNNGLIQGATSVAGISGNCFQFYGSHNIQIPHSNVINFASNQDFTISVWVKIPTIQNNTGAPDNNIYLKGSEAATNWRYPYVLRVNNQTAPSYIGGVYGTRYDGNSAGCNHDAPAGAGLLNNNQWQNVVYSKSGYDVKMFVNGVINVTQPDNTTNTCGTQNNSNLCLGCNSFTGLIDEFRIYNRSLTDIEIQQLYQHR
jgi:hypothetical protein